MRLLFVALAVSGCATAGTEDQRTVDAATGQTDSSTNPLVDAAVTIDSSTGGCTTVTRDLLTNGNFEGSPAGTGWTAMPINASYPIVTGDSGGVAAQSPANRAWMGGIEQSAATNKDSLYQDVMVPASTTALVLTGFYEVRTGEVGGGVYDRATVEVTNTSNTQIELIKALDDNGATTAWTALNHTFAQLSAIKGQTVRLKFSTASDALDPTSFFFDTLKLEATHCQ